MRSPDQFGLLFFGGVLDLAFCVRPRQSHRLVTHRFNSQPHAGLQQFVFSRSFSAWYLNDNRDHPPSRPAPPLPPL